MNDENALFRAIENAEMIQNAISNFGGVSALEKFVETLETTESVIQQSTGMLRAIERLGDIPAYEVKLDSMLKAYTNAVTVAMSPAFRNSMRAATTFLQSKDATTFINNVISSSVSPPPQLSEYLEKASKECTDYSWVTEEALTAAANMPSPDVLSLSENGAVVFEGITYTEQELHEELNQEIKQAKKEKLPLREKYEQFKKSHWILFVLVFIFWTIPELKSKAQFYVDLVEPVVEQIVGIQDEGPKICYVINERAYFREEPYAKAKVIKMLLYDTPLEIVEEIPRWYKVKYEDSDGQECIGWISKISVETVELLP